MKFGVFFIPLLIATVYSLPLKNLIKDPVALVASLSTADPDSVQKLKDYVAQLVAEGEAEEAAFTAIRDAAQAVLDQETTDLINAEAALLAAQDVHAAATDKEAAAVAVELAKRSDREAKLAIKQDKQALLDEAIETDKNEQERLNRERGLFEKIKQLLNGIKANGRRLLSSEKADPAQVDEARRLLDNLIEAGEVERQGVIDALNAAQDAFDIASEIHAASIPPHVLAEGALDDARLELADAVSVLALRTSQHASAVVDKQSATDDLAVKQQKLDDEAARIASEALDLEMISDLLEKL